MSQPRGGTMISHILGGSSTCCHVLGEDPHARTRQEGVPNGKLITSMVVDALFSEKARRREMDTADSDDSRALLLEAWKEVEVKEEVIKEEGYIKRDCPKYKAYDQSSEIAATTVIVVDKRDDLLTASANEKSDWVLDSRSAYHLCRGSEVFSIYATCERLVRMANNMANRVVGELLLDMGIVVLARRMDKGSNCCIEARKASVGVPRGSEVRAPQWGVEGTSMRRSYRGARLEAVRMDNLKTSDYPPMGWRGRLLSPAHLDEFKPSSQAQAQLAHMECPCESETLELSKTLERIISR
ncbi:hypothetical protein Acr_00g0055260 [Actinidia rufa]|uniref:Uncharacterized protein n=1 Tax=Actinidia rufa TaxID=165716 RepID=A0A7J0DM40_9ERIC|nr:hypothetical protein Acr_00g0055260 [Actinidia rufa]